MPEYLARYDLYGRAPLAPDLKAFARAFLIVPWQIGQGLLNRRDGERGAPVVVR
jgi:hypothetical protein